MATNVRHVNVPMNGQARSVAGSVGRFLWHLLQMMLAMMAGMMVYNLLLGTLLAGTGYAALTKADPLFGYWMMVVSMPLGMIALMRYHRSSWRDCMEMTIAMLAPLAALTVLVLCHLIPIQTLKGFGDPMMLLAMAVYMLYRPGEHAHGAHEHSGHQHAGSRKARTTAHSQHDAHEAHQHEPTEHAVLTRMISNSRSKSMPDL